MGLIRSILSGSIALVLPILAALIISAQPIQRTPLSLDQVEKLVKNRTPDIVIAREIRERGVTVVLTRVQIDRIRKIGGKKRTIDALEGLSFLPDPNSTSLRVLVADFPGLSGENRAFKETITQRLNEISANQSGVQILFGEGTYDIRDRNTAKKVASQLNADIVFWGWYSASGTTAIVSSNFELTPKLDLDPKSIAQGKLVRGAISKLDSFDFQLEIADECSAIVLLAMGLKEMDRSDEKKAINYFTSALEQRGVPDHLRAYVFRLRGEARWELANSRDIRNERESRADIAESLTLEPNNIQSRLSLARLLTERGEFDEAISILQYALEQTVEHSERWEIYHTLASASSGKGEKKESEEFEAKCVAEIKSIEDSWSRNIGLALHLFLKQSPVDTRNALFEASKVADTNESALTFYFIGLTYFFESFDQMAGTPKERDLVESGRLYFRKAAEFDRELSDFGDFFELIVVLRNPESRINEKLKSSLDKLISKQPNDAALYSLRATVYELMEDFQSALSDLKKALRIDFQSRRTHEDIARFHFRRSEYGVALKEFEFCNSIEERFETYQDIAFAFDKSHNYLDYRRALAEALRLEPAFVEDYWDILAGQESISDDVKLSVIGQLSDIGKSPYLLFEKALWKVEFPDEGNANSGSKEYEAATKLIDESFVAAATDKRYSDKTHLFNVCRAGGDLYQSTHDAERGISFLNKCLTVLGERGFDRKDLYSLLDTRSYLLKIAGECKSAMEDRVQVLSSARSEISHRDFRAIRKGLTFDAERLAVDRMSRSVSESERQLLNFENARDFRNARKELLLRIERNGDSSWPIFDYFGRAAIYRNQLSFEENLQLLNKLVEETQSSVVMIEKGVLFADRAGRQRDDLVNDDYKFAMETFQSALQVEAGRVTRNNPMYLSDICGFLSDEFISRGDAKIGFKFASACIELLAAKKCDCDSISRAYQNRGSLLFYFGEFDASLSDFVEALNKSDQDIALRVRSDTDVWLLAPRKALETINAAIGTNPDSATLYYLRALLHRSMLEPQKAIADMKTALDKDKNTARKNDLRSYLELRMQR